MKPPRVHREPAPRIPAWLGDLVLKRGSIEQGSGGSGPLVARLGSIAGDYSVLWHWEDASQSWTFYLSQLAALSTRTELEFGGIYWIGVEVPAALAIGPQTQIFVTVEGELRVRATVSITVAPAGPSDSHRLDTMLSSCCNAECWITQPSAGRRADPSGARRDPGRRPRHGRPFRAGPAPQKAGELRRHEGRGALIPVAPSARGGQPRLGNATVTRERADESPA